MNKHLNDFMILAAVAMVVGTVIGLTMVGAVEAIKAVVWLFN